jgi:hypothetical protein
MAHKRKVRFKERYPDTTETDLNVERDLKEKCESLIQVISDKNAENEKLTAQVDEMNSRLEIFKEQSDEKISFFLEALHKSQEELLFLRAHFTKEETDLLKKPDKFYYGARQRVEDDLPYRLGLLIIQSTKTPKGVAKLPKLLLKEYNSFKETEEHDLPPLESYIDAAEAEKAKQHLTYRVGLAAIESINSPRELLKLPFELTKEVYFFKHRDKK